MNDGYMGTGVWIRIQHRFGPRMMEWFYSIHMIVFGGVLLLPSMTFNQPAFLSFQKLVPSEDFRGWIMLLVGCLRIIGLVITASARKSESIFGKHDA